MQQPAIEKEPSNKNNNNKNRKLAQWIIVSMHCAKNHVDHHKIALLFIDVICYERIEYNQLGMLSSDIYYNCTMAKIISRTFNKSHPVNQWIGMGNCVTTHTYFHI